MRISRAIDRLTVALIVILVASCLAQDRVESISGVLNKAAATGSLAYWNPAGCDSLSPLPLPKIRPTNYSGSPREALQEMFADDPNMRVTQEPGGMIRMFEKDVPTDLLDLKIHHISFPGKYAEFRGSTFLLWTIMQTPEVQAFAKAHNIGPLYSNRMPGNPFPGLRQVHRELEDVTVSQALDYVLLAYPGYWIYENCKNTEGGREVFFWFVEK
jgi:hypothetical protein